LDKEESVQFVVSCQNPDGGFAGNIGHDSHLLYTLSSIQILVMFDALDKIDVEKVATCICSFFFRFVSLFSFC